MEENGCEPYAFSKQSFDVTSRFGIVQLSQQAYADDHTLVNRSLRGAQRSLDLVARWLDWTQCMHAKPAKCKSLGLSRTNVWFRDPTDQKTYSAFDPKLTIAGCTVTFIADDPFKCLGRLMYANLSDTEQRKLVITQMTTDMQTIDNTPLKGIAKRLVV